MFGIIFAIPYFAISDSCHRRKIKTSKLAVAEKINGVRAKLNSYRGGFTDPTQYLSWFIPLLLQQIWVIMSEIFQIIGLGIFILGGIAYLVAAFRTSIIWGLGCLFITPVSILYLFFHWGDAKKPFLIQVIGGVVMLASVYAQGTQQF